MPASLRFQGGPQLIRAMRQLPQNVQGQVLQQSLDSLLAGDKYMCDTDMDSSVVICTMEGGFQPANAGFQKKLEKITETFWEEFGVKVRIAVSTICRDGDRCRQQKPMNSFTCGRTVFLPTPNWAFLPSPSVVTNEA